ncbi:MAG: sugar ABC transporter permease [Candidatus Omnitrophota bacterium]|jgi:ABC-type sugar transport system permease subunit
MKLRDTLENYVFVAPAVTIFSIFYIIPFIWVFQLGMFEWDGISFTKTFVGLANFKEIFLQDKSWWQAMWNATYITLIALTLQNILAFMLAWACDREIRMKNFYRVVFFIPPVLSEVVVGMVWRFIINDIDGANIINRMFAGIGLPQLMHNWLSDPQTALTTVALVHCWKGFGWGFLIFLAGLQTIPRELYEAARVDGANAWQSFKKITIPLMIPVVVVVAILTVLGTMQVFVLIVSLVGGEFAGHTSVPVLRILASMRGSSRFGYACAQGITFGMVLVAISFIQYRFSKERQGTTPREKR